MNSTDHGAFVHIRPLTEVERLQEEMERVKTVQRWTLGLAILTYVGTCFLRSRVDKIGDNIDKMHKNVVAIDRDLYVLERKSQ